MKVLTWENGEKIIRNMTNEEIAEMQPSAEELAANARKRRNAFLVASDWTQVADAPVDQAAWATYRQALRDLPEQRGFPRNIEWPVEP